MRYPTAVLLWSPSPDAAFVAMPVYSETDERVQLARLKAAGTTARVFILEEPAATARRHEWVRATSAEVTAGFPLPESQRHREVTR